MPITTLSCYLVGTESLLIECAEIWLAHGHAIRGVISADARISDWARERDVTIIEPGPGMVDRMGADPFDYLFSVTNLRMLSGDVLRLADRASINFHDGPLPEYAGLNCPVWALLEGATRYGVTWHLMEDRPDTGDILQQHMFDVAPTETALTLNTKCYEAGIESFTALADDITANRLTPTTQDLTTRRYYGLAKRPVLGGTILWSNPAEQIATLVRALDFGNYANPVASAKVYTPAGVVRVTAATATSTASTAEPGNVVAADGEGVTVGTGSTDLRLTVLATLDC